MNLNQNLTRDEDVGEEALLWYQGYNDTQINAQNKTITCDLFVVFNEKQSMLLEDIIYAI